MFKPAFPYRLYLVVSDADCRFNFLDTVDEAILGGVDIVQLREKQLNDADYIARALQLKAVTDRYQVPLIINDNLAVARHVNAFGIHVGNQDMAPTQIQETWSTVQSIGYSIEYLEQLDTKEAETASYLAASPVFPTSTKTNTVTAWGLEGIKTIRARSNKPLVAIGGINLSNARQIINAGADSLAIVSAICAADDPRKAAQQLKNEILKSR